MIEIRNVIDLGIDGAFRGMRNPYMSHHKSDSIHCDEVDCSICPMNRCPDGDIRFAIGEEDMKLAKRLIKAGSEHRKFLRMIHVLADVKAPRYWWAEMDKYKFVEANSSSTMHLITKRNLTIDDFGSVNNGVREALLYSIIPTINEWIHEYQTTGDPEHKNDVFRSIKQLLPESYLQLRTIDFDYETALTIWHQRHAHRLLEWHEFCDWLETLPYMKDFLEAFR